MNKLQDAVTGLAMMIAVQELGGEAHKDDIEIQANEILCGCKTAERVVSRAVRVGFSGDYIKRILSVDYNR